MDEKSVRELHTGRQIPVVGLGTWKLVNDIAETVRYAIERGYRLLDTSSDYGTQPGIGEAVRTSGISRENLYIVTKVEETDDAYEASQKYVGEMGLEYADLILIHRPPMEGAGEDLWRGLIKARNTGLIKDIGVSNYPINLIEKLVSATGEIPTVNQIEWSPFGHSRKILDYARKKNILIQAYSPLTRAKRLDDPALVSFSEKYGKTPAQILIRWNLQLGIVPIPKANQKPHLEENLRVFDFEIEEEDMQKLGDLNERYSALGKLPYE